MRKKAALLLVALTLLLSLDSAQAQFFSSPALQVPLAIVDAVINILKFITNVTQTFVLMFCNMRHDDANVKAAYYSLMVHRPNENVTSCLIGCIASAAYNIKEGFVNVTRIDPFFPVRFIMGERNYQQLQYCARNVQDDTCAMGFLFIDCVVNHFYSKFRKDVHDFQDGIRRIVNRFPHLVQEYVAKDGIPGGFFDIAMGLPTLIPMLLNVTTPVPYESTTTTTMFPQQHSTDQPYELHILTPSPASSTPFAYPQNSVNLSHLYSN